MVAGMIEDEAANCFYMYVRAGAPGRVLSANVMYIFNFQLSTFNIDIIKNTRTTTRTHTPSINILE